MGETVLISTFYSFQPLVAAAHKYSPTRIILLVAEETLDKPEVRAAIQEARKTYGVVAAIDFVRLPGPDLLGIAKRTAEILDLYGKFPGSRVIVNVSGGWKLLSQGALYGCYARPNKVEKIVCNDLSADRRVVELPKLGFGLKRAKKRLLSEISNRDGKSIEQIAKKLGRSRGMAYQHLKDLKEMGYVDEKFEITVAGRLALI